jgi:hypothetical protein
MRENASHSLAAVTLIALGLCLASCVSPGGGAAAPNPTFGPPDMVLDRSLTEAGDAAARVLASMSFHVVRRQSDYVEGRRPNKVGKHMETGGETVRIWLEAFGPRRTAVRVKTSQTFVGIAGQRNWDDHILTAMAGR